MDREVKKWTWTKNELTRRWTDASSSCYKNKLQCSSCENREICRAVCETIKSPNIFGMKVPPIKEITIELYRKFGNPEVKNEQRQI